MCVSQFTANTLLLRCCSQGKGTWSLQLILCIAPVAEMGRQLALRMWDQTRCCALLNFPLDTFQSLGLWHQEATTGEDEETQQGWKMGRILLQWESRAQGKSGCTGKVPGAERFGSSWTAYWQSMLPVLTREKKNPQQEKTRQNRQPWSLASWKK